jgi:hypothetical protein
LLNSDRHANNLLVDSDNRLWFFDHDGALWGDGYPAEMLGDLNNHICPDAIKTERPIKWFGDYLKSGTLSRAVWNDSRMSQEMLTLLFDRMSLDLSHLEKARASMPRGWLHDARMKDTCAFFKEWWSIFRAFVNSANALIEIRARVATIRTD